MTTGARKETEADSKKPAGQFSAMPGKGRFLPLIHFIYTQQRERVKNQQNEPQINGILCWSEA